MEQASLEAVMGLIVHGGNAKSEAMEAIQAAKVNDFVKAQEKLESAEEFLLQAHHSQTEMLTKEAQGDSLPITLLTIHSQDHLMTAITFTDLAKEIVAVYQKMAEQEK